MLPRTYMRALRLARHYGADATKYAAFVQKPVMAERLRAAIAKAEGR